MTGDGQGVTVRTVDTEPTVDVQLLAQAERQTDALESLRTIALAWSAIAVLVAVIWLIVAINGGR